MAFVCLAALLPGLGACGKKEENEASGGLFAPKPEGTFRIAVTGLPDSLNPVVATGEEAREFFLLAYDPLWRIDENYDPQPCLVESWDISSDGLVWTIRLRQDVYFSDPAAEEPQQLTSADVQFSYELFMRHSSFYRHYFDGISSIRCPDSFTVVITTEEIKGDMLYNPTPILPRYLWQSCKNNPEDMDNSAMIGTGPFLYQSQQLPEGEQQEDWSFLANEDYFAGAPGVAELRFIYEAVPASAAMMLVDGAVDACMGLTDIQLMAMEGMPGVEIFDTQGPGRGRFVLAMNTLSGGLDDARVREAIECCLDKERIFSVAFGGIGKTGVGFGDPGGDYYLDVADPHSFNKEYAATLLQTAGYQDYDGDDILETQDNTQELRFSLYTSLSEEWTSAAETILAGDLESLGIHIDWVTRDTASITDVCRKEGDWDLYLGSLPSGIDAQYAASSFANGNSETGWQDETYDSLYAQFCTTVDPQQRVALCQRLQQIVLDSAPYEILAYGYDVQAIRADKWTGYQSCLAAAGGLFGTGSASAYMSIRPIDEKDRNENPPSGTAFSEEMTPAPTDEE